MRLRLLAFALAVAAATPAFAAPDPAPSFDYDANTVPAPPGLGPQTSPAPGVTAQQIDYFLGDRRVSAEMIRGAGPGPHPAVLFVHWLGDPATTNHTEFEADAIALARLGVSSMLIDAPWSQKGWFGPLGGSAEGDLRDSAGTVVELRRCLDTLLASPDVDPSRVAFVGHDFGAMFGMLMASVDHRPAWYVFMAPNSSMGEWYLWEKKTPDRDAYLARLRVLDPPGFLARAKARGVLLQFSGHDEYITPAHQAAIVAAAPSPHTVKVYDVDHSLETPAAHADRLAWLKAALLAPH
ncbi:dienelactone hydrolase family protein [Caulobacter sp. KR2-114]|uniref:dienelactone hydrolase family protein n=1 Tax=Caulobacter sp. KR2-114 TaxID=3400912 RepID=UPI003C039A26